MLQSVYLMQQSHPGPDGVFRVRLVGTRISEICEDSIAQIPGGEAAVPPDREVATCLIMVKNPHQFFGIEPRG